jgi:hypothetical protein
MPIEPLTVIDRPADADPRDDTQFVRVLRRLAERGCDADPESPVAVFSSAF